MFFADGYFVYSRFKVYVVFTSQMLLQTKIYIMPKIIFHSRLTLPQNLLLLFQKTVYQYLFTFSSIFVLYKAGQQNLYLA